MAFSPRARVLVIAAVVFAALGALVWYLSTEYWTQPVTPLPAADSGVESDVTYSGTARPPAPSSSSANETRATPQASPALTPGASVATPTPQASATPPQQTSAPSSPSSSAATNLLIPVLGVRPEQLQDTYSDARSEGRVHNAIDIVAPRGTPVVAAADGRVVKLFTSAKGGLTLYQLGTDERTVYYYAHLDRYADGLAEGHLARRGETIAYVGDTGNVTPGNYHLHFQVYLISDPQKFWMGENLNPYPLLRNAP